MGPGHGHRDELLGTGEFNGSRLRGALPLSSAFGWSRNVPLSQIKARENGKVALGPTGKPTPPEPTDMNLLAELLT